MRVGVNELAGAIAKELEEYSQEVTENLKEEVVDAAKECVQILKEKSPEDTGAYKKGWKAKVEYESEEDIRVRVYNSKKPQLTQLLERGHAGKDGTAKGSAKPYPHIQPAEKAASEKLLKKVKVVIAR